MLEAYSIEGHVTITKVVTDLRKHFGIKLHRETVVRWLRRHNVPTVKVGTAYLFPASRFIELLAEYSGEPHSNRQGTGK